MASISSFFSKVWPVTDRETAAMQAASNFTKLPHPLHPYYPAEVEILGYVANDMSLLQLLGTFFSGLAVIWGISYMVVTRVRPNLSRGDMLVVLWFVLCKCPANEAFWLPNEVEERMS